MGVLWCTSSNCKFIYIFSLKMGNFMQYWAILLLSENICRISFLKHIETVVTSPMALIIDRSIDWLLIEAWSLRTDHGDGVSYGNPHYYFYIVLGLTRTRNQFPDPQSSKEVNALRKCYRCVIQWEVRYQQPRP